MTAPARTPVHVLDSTEAYALDRGGMFEHVARVGAELERAWRLAADVPLPPAIDAATSIVVAGIGGSATAGDYLATLSSGTSARPVSVVQGFCLPAWVGPSTLVVVCSYSGNTAETLSACEAAAERGAMLVAVTRGGTLAERARRMGIPLYPIAYDSPPRAATVHTLAPLLRLGTRLGAIGCDDALVSAAAQAHRALVSRLEPAVHAPFNEAKRLAEALHGRVPIVLGGAHLGAAAGRFKNQLAENGKTIAAADLVPEAGHNLVVGLATARRAPAAFALVTLEAVSADPRILARFDAVATQFVDAAVPVHRVRIDGGSQLADLLLATAWGDFVSCYLALLNAEDPTPIPQIERVRAFGS